MGKSWAQDWVEESKTVPSIYSILTSTGTLKRIELIVEHSYVGHVAAVLPTTI